MGLFVLPCEASRTSETTYKNLPFSTRKGSGEGTGGTEGICFWSADSHCGSLRTNLPSPPFFTLVGAPGHQPRLHSGGRTQGLPPRKALPQGRACPSCRP